MTLTMRTEVGHLQSQMRREMQTLADEVDNRRELLRNEADLFASSRKLASSKAFVLLMPNGKYCCGTCTTHSGLFKHPSQRHSPWILGNGGVKYNFRFTNQVWQHEQSEMHLLSMEWDLSRQRNPLEFSLQQQLLDSRIITENLFRTVYDNATHYRSFLDYENLIWLAHCCGSEVGDQLHSRNTAASMLGVIYHTDRITIKTFISTPSAATGRLPQVGVAADKVSDKRFKQWQCNALRVNLVGSP